MPRRKSVSWIIPVLNGMPYLTDMLASLEAQTFDDAEVLVWDNGSTDGTLEVLRQWIPHRLPGRVFSGEPLSLGNSLRRLVEAANTEFCARMDADDLCLPHRLERQLNFLSKHPDIALVGSERDCMDADGLEISARSHFPSEPHEILHATLRSPRLLHPTVVFRRRELLSVGNYQDRSTPEFPYWCEDYDLWLRLLSRYRVAALPDKLIRYRYHAASLTETEMRLKRASGAKRQAWILNAEAFAGISSTEKAARLWDKEMPLALPTLLNIAKHFRKLDGIPVGTRLRMDSFRNSIASFVARRDLLTRVWLKWITRRPGAETWEGSLFATK